MTVIAQETPQSNSAPPKIDQLIVAEWPLKRGEVVRVSIELYKNTWLVNVRRWFEADSGEIRPSKGIAISIKHLPCLAEAITDALVISRERGLLPNEMGSGK